jgi:exonuclease III
MNGDISNLNLVISSLNVNSLNVSTLGVRNAKTLLKIEGITSKRADVILLSDIRLKDSEGEVRKLFNLTMNGSYKLYVNSTRDSRGVGVAIKRSISHEIKGTILDRVDENYILLDMIIKGKKVVLGSVYGPNGNNVNFYEKLKRDIERLGQPFIIGGDFNTILCNELGEGNVDRKGDGRVPNPHNSRIINQWITEGFVIEPFRVMYPFQTEVSHIPFRSARDDRGGLKYVNNRLDFFLSSPNVIENISKVVYEDRLQADFDHKEVILHLGKKVRRCKINIFDRTLKDLLSDTVGVLAVYEILSAHLTTQDPTLNNNVKQLDILIREKELLRQTMRIRGGNVILMDRIGTVDQNIETIINRLPVMHVMMERDFLCNHRKLYEVMLMNLKNRLVALQKKRLIEGNEERNLILDRILYMESKFGENSQQAGDERDRLLRFDDIKLKERATAFREFLDANNEKATKVFCKLSKDGGVCDNQEIIKNCNGEDFGSSKERSEYIRKYYEGVYKKRLDSLINIESFLGEDFAQEGWINNRKLSEQESLELEGEVTIDELKESLDNSNFGSTSGWD